MSSLKILSLGFERKMRLVLSLLKMFSQKRSDIEITMIYSIIGPQEL